MGNLAGANLFIIRSERDKRKLWDALKATSLPWRVTVRTTTKSTRSPDFNRFYWGVLLAKVAEFTGHTKDEVHHSFKERLLPLNPEIPDSEPTTSNLDSDAFGDYVEWCRALALTELGILIESPTDFL